MYIQKRRACCHSFGKEANGTVSGGDAMPYRDLAEILRGNSELVVFKARIVDCCLNIVNSVAAKKSGNAIVFNCSISNIGFSAIAFLNVNPIGCEAKDIAAFNE